LSQLHPQRARCRIRLRGVRVFTPTLSTPPYDNSTDEYTEGVETHGNETEYDGYGGPRLEFNICRLHTRRRAVPKVRSPFFLFYEFRPAALVALLYILAPSSYGGQSITVSLRFPIPFADDRELARVFKG
jgi:hypothetical protein